MSNLKKILALVLALVMSFSLVSVSSAAFKDEANITDVYAESADVLATLGVFKGYEDGSFNPKGSITRAEVAAIIYRVATGDVTDKQVGIYADYNVFSDVKSDAWYAGYVNYCANAQYIKGYGNGKFGPNDTVTGYQALAMILRAVGYDKNGEFTGPTWQVETAKIGNQLKITGNVNAGLLGTAATREVVAEILFRAINVPTVTYTLALGYNQYQEIVTVLGQKTLNKTLGQLNFGLEKQTGVLDSFNPGNDSVVLEYVDANKVERHTPSIVGIEADLDSIGHAYYIYTVPTAGAKTLTAVSDAYLVGTDLLTSTYLFPYDYIVKYPMVKLDTDVKYYYNGVEFDKDIADGKNKLATVGQTGVKVTFIDNDNGGLAEVVSIIDYTPARVTAVTNDYNTGVDGAVAKSTYLNYNRIATSKIVTKDELVYNDYVTYVVYNTYYFVDEVDYVTGKFESIERDYVTANEYWNWSYTVDGVDYLTSKDFDQKGNYELVQANLQKTVILGLDPYGHVITSALYADPTAFLYVIANEQTKQLTGLTETMVAFSDGSIKNVNVDFVDVAANSYFEATLEGTTRNSIRSDIYAYTVDADGNYVLYTIPCQENTVAFAYTTGRAAFGGMGLDNKTVVVDLRPASATFGKVFVGHTGENAVPSLNVKADGVHYIDLNNDGIIELAYLTGADNALALTDFVVFKTTTNKVLGNAITGYTYLLDVLVDGVLVKNYELTAKEYAEIERLGVGFYSFDRYGNLSWYDSFPELWLTATWANGTLSVDYNNDGIVDDFYKYGEIPFQVINVAKGTADSYLMNHGVDRFTVRAIPVWNPTYTAVVEMYIIADYTNVAEYTGEVGNKTHVNFPGVNGKAVDYFVESGKITTPIVYLNAFETALSDAEKALQEAQAEYDEIVKALKDAGYELKAAETVDYAKLIKALEDAKAKLTAAVQALQTALSDASAEDKAEYADRVNAVLNDDLVKTEMAADAVNVTKVVVIEKAATDDSLKALAAEYVVDLATEDLTKIEVKGEDGKTVTLKEVKDAAVEELKDSILDTIVLTNLTYTVEGDASADALIEGLTYDIEHDAAFIAAEKLGDISVEIMVAADAKLPEVGSFGDVKVMITLTQGENTKTVATTVTVTVKAKKAQ